MCMKNVNVNTIFTEKDPTDDCGRVSFGSLANEIQARVTDNNNIVVDKLTIVTFFNAFSEDEDGELDKKFGVQWMLESSDVVNKRRILLAESDYDTAKNKRDKMENKTCRSFSNQIYIIKTKNIELTEEGRYFLKVYLKGNEEDLWQIQSINTIYIKKREE